jgi:hypothetical protein
LFVLQRNDQLLSSANLKNVTVLQSRRQDNSLVGLKVAVIGEQAYALRLKTPSTPPTTPTPNPHPQTHARGLRYCCTNLDVGSGVNCLMAAANHVILGYQRRFHPLSVPRGRARTHGDCAVCHEVTHTPPPTLLLLLLKGAAAADAAAAVCLLLLLLLIACCCCCMWQQVQCLLFW